MLLNVIGEGGVPMSEKAFGGLEGIELTDEFLEGISGGVLSAYTQDHLARSISRAKELGCSLDETLNGWREIYRAYFDPQGRNAEELNAILVFISENWWERLGHVRPRHSRKELGPRISAGARVQHAWWRRGGSNSGPKQLPDEYLQAQSLVESRTFGTQRQAPHVPAGLVLAAGIPTTSCRASP